MADLLLYKTPGRRPLAYHQITLKPTRGRVGEAEMTMHSTAAEPGAEARKGRAHRVLLLGAEDEVRLRERPTIRLLALNDPLMLQLFHWRYDLLEEYGWLPRNEDGAILHHPDRSDRDEYDDLGPKHTTHVILLGREDEIVGYVRLLTVEPSRFMMFNDKRFVAMLTGPGADHQATRRTMLIRKIADQHQRDGGHCMEVTRLCFSLTHTLARKQDIVLQLLSAMLWECTFRRTSRAFALVSPASLQLLNSVGVEQDQGGYPINPEAFLVKFTPETVFTGVERFLAERLRRNAAQATCVA